MVGGAFPATRVAILTDGLPDGRGMGRVSGNSAERMPDTRINPAPARFNPRQRFPRKVEPLESIGGWKTNSIQLQKQHTHVSIQFWIEHAFSTLTGFYG